MDSSRETRILLVGSVRIIGYQYENAAYNNITCILFCVVSVLCPADFLRSFNAFVGTAYRKTV